VARPGGFAAGIWIVAIVALVELLGISSLARAQDVSPFVNLVAGACDQVDYKNMQVSPRDTDIVAACAALRRGAVLGQRFSGGPGAIALLIAGLVLTYVVLGVPLRSVAGLLERASGRSTTILSLEAGLAVVLRACVGLLVLAVLRIPYAIAAGCATTGPLGFIHRQGGAAWLRFHQWARGLSRFPCPVRPFARSRAASYRGAFL
jgi:hypothetical protein